MFASKRVCFLALGAPSFPFPLRNYPSGLRVGFWFSISLRLAPFLFGFRFVAFLLLLVAMAPAPDVPYAH
jgi:hypothetical protein